MDKTFAIKWHDEWRWLFLVFVIALMPRLYALFTWPMGGDEVVVVGRQIELYTQALAAGDGWSILVDIPLYASNGMTPLWGWLQTLVYYCFAGAALSVRVLPFVFSLAGVFLIYIFALCFFDRKTAVFAASVAGLSDLGIYLAVNGEMTETFLLCCSVCAFFLLLRAERRTFLAFLCFALASFTYFGKGVFLALVTFTWLCVADLWPGFFRGENLKLGLQKCAQNVYKAFLAFIPVFLWLGLAQYRIGAVLQQGLVIQTDMGQARSILQVMRQCSVDYFKIRGFHASGPKGTLMVYTDLPAWPTSTLLFPFFVIGMMLILPRIARETDSERRRMLFLFPVFGLGVFFYLLWRGIDGERFHFFYHPVFALACGVALKKISEVFVLTKKTALYFLFFLSYWAFSANIESWRGASFNGLGFLATSAVLSTIIWAAWKWGLPRPRWILQGYLLLMVYLLYQVGPLYWGRFHVHGMPSYYARAFEEKLRAENPMVSSWLYLPMTHKTIIPLEKNALRPEWRLPPL